jgi:hypothetical protein
MDGLMSPDNESTTGHLPAGRSHPIAFGLPHPHRIEHGETNPDILAKLEWLDDLMFEAIEGDAVALETAVDAWRKTLDDLGTDALEESRQQYLRRAQSVWNELRVTPNHPPHKVFAAIEIISMLAAKAW